MKSERRIQKASLERITKWTRKNHILTLQESGAGSAAKWQFKGDHILTLSRSQVQGVWQNGNLKVRRQERGAVVFLY